MGCKKLLLLFVMLTVGGWFIIKFGWDDSEFHI